MTLEQLKEINRWKNVAHKAKYDFVFKFWKSKNYPVAVLYDFETHNLNDYRFKDENPATVYEIFDHACTKLWVETYTQDETERIVDSIFKELNSLCMSNAYRNYVRIYENIIKTHLKFMRERMLSC